MIYNIIYNINYNIMKHIDKCVYINLEYRIDRKQQIENQLNNFDINYERFNAYHYPNIGIYGCMLSHLEVSKKNNYKNILIFEDDFIFLVDKNEFENRLNEFFDSKYAEDYNVLFLSYSLNLFNNTDNENILKVIFSQTTSRYIVNSNYYDKLIELYES